MDEGMTRRATLDLSQSNQVASFEITSAVLELPER